MSEELEREISSVDAQVTVDRSESALACVFHPGWGAKFYKQSSGCWSGPGGNYGPLTVLGIELEALLQRQAAGHVVTFVINDFTHCLNLAGLNPQEAARCVAGWRVNGERRQTGFLVELKSGSFAYATGSCHESGWGLEDDASIVFFDQQPDLSSFTTACGAEWIIGPAALNAWIREGAADPYPFL